MTSIYDYGFDKSLNKPIDDASTGVVYDTVENALNTGSILQGGNLTLKTLSIGSLVRQVAPGDDIQAAIDAVNREGGGRIQFLAKTYALKSNINLKSNVSLEGAGKDITVLDFQGQVLQISGNSVSNFLLKDFTVKNSSAVEAIRITACSSFIFNNIAARENASSGIRIRTTSTDFIILGCEADDNGDTGIADNTSAKNSNYFACSADSNDNYGFEFESGSSFASCVGCSANNNGVVGFRVAEAIGRFYNCTAESNLSYDFQLNTATGSVLVGNVFGSVQIDGGVNSIGNAKSSTKTEQRIYYMKNVSGAAIRDGNVVVFASNSNGDAITTTNINGDNKIFGMVRNSGISNNQYGYVMTEGWTGELYVNNGTASISVGDWLSAYSHAYYAKKAITGDMVFAMALSAPTTGTAQIDALLVSPRLI